jgi:tRNA nucleotidyltransferase/poly(A) polymerase
VGDEALRLPLPTAVSALLEALERAGHQACAQGRCVSEIARGVTPAAFEIGTSARFETLLALFPHGVVTAPQQLTLASGAGPLDVRPFPDAEGSAGELARRDFTLHALALRRDGALLDPHGGRADLAGGVLRATGDPEARFAEDPVRVLRAARLVAELDFELEPDTEKAAARVAEQIVAQRPARVRAELSLLMLAPHVEAGLRTLRRLGLEAALAPGVAADAPSLVARLPRDLELRLAAWLIEARAVSTLRGLRYPRARVQRVERLLQLHPIDAGPAHAREQRVRRLARRSPPDLEGLVALREAEIALRAEGDAAARRVAPLREALEHTLRADRLADARAELAIGGEDVMKHLGIGPGSHIGRALNHLARCVAEDPSRNRRDALLALLDEWLRTQEEDVRWRHPSV